MEDFECIVVDDGSTDKSIEAACAAIEGDKRFRIVKIQHDGLSTARNVGIDNAHGDIVFHVDADDEAMPEMLEKAAAFLEENCLEMVFFDAESRTDSEASSVGKSVKRYFTRKTNYGISSGRAMLDAMASNGDFVYAAFIQAARKSAIRRKFFRGLRAQDMLYTTQNLFLADRVGHLTETLYVKNTTVDSVSLSRPDAHYAWSMLTTFLEIQKFAEKECQERCIGLEAVADQAFQALTYAVENLNEDDWQDAMKMGFTERTMLASIGRLVYTPAVKRRLERTMPKEWKWICGAVQAK